MEMVKFSHGRLRYKTAIFADRQNQSRNFGKDLIVTN